MKYWMQLLNSDPDGLIEICQFAEELGFEGVMEGDHWFMPALSDDHDPDERAPMPWDYRFLDIFVAAGAVLASTKALKFGSGVMVLANRTNPFLVAKGAATAARLSGDRFVLGVGAGWMKAEYDIAGVDWSTRGTRTAEMIDVLRKLWSPGPAQHHGRFFDFPATYAEPRPNKPVPIYIGAIAPPALRRAGRVGDGWAGMTSEPDAIPAQIELVNEGRREAGRIHEAFEFMIGLRHNDGRIPSADDYRAAKEMGITKLKLDPVEHRLRKPYCTLDEKKRVMEDFANSIMRANI
ncbi:MAG: TIGR03619 family F420-dependent LLM class oxidoreductase [Georgfuchsia sp.]